MKLTTGVRNIKLFFSVIEAVQKYVSVSHWQAFEAKS